MAPKRWNIFKFADSWDLWVLDCQVEGDFSALAAGLKEIGSSLIRLARSREPLPAETRWDNEVEAAGCQPLMVMPPRCQARSFSCRLSYPDRTRLDLRADLATLNSFQARVELEGQIRVVSSTGVSLDAEQASWQVTAQRLAIYGKYDLHKGELRLTGRGGDFLLKDGKIMRRGASPRPPPAPVPDPTAHFLPQVLTTAFFGKGQVRVKPEMAPFIFLAMMQGGNAGDLLNFAGELESEGVSVPGPTPPLETKFEKFGSPDAESD